MFQAPSQISKIGTLADNTIRITVDCQELSPEQMAEVFKLKNDGLGWFLFKNVPITETDIPDSKPEFKNDKTPSQRLRACLYKFWELNTDRKINFDDFWKKWVNKKCEEIKELLPND